MTKEKFYKRMWFIWVLIVFLPPIGIIYMWIAKKDLQIGKKVAITIVGILWCVICLAMAPDTGNTDQVAQSDTTESSAKEEQEEQTTQEATTEEVSEAELEAFEMELSAGHYEIGVDMPAGKYNLECLSGMGNVSSSNMMDGGLNVVMSTDTSDGYSVDSFNNAKFSDGDILTVTSTAVVKVTSGGVDKSAVSSRTPEGAEIELSSGNFVAGTDFEAGVYDITCIEGMGNVSSSNIIDGGLNEVMDVSAGNGITVFKNASLKDGIELTISGCKVKLTPSK